MADADSLPRGFIAAVAIFWFLAAGLLGAAFWLFQETEQAQRRIDQIGVEKRRLTQDAVALEAAADKLRGTLDNDAKAADASPAAVRQADDAALASVRQKLGAAPHVAAALAAARQRVAALAARRAALDTEKLSLDRQLARVREEQRTVDQHWADLIKSVEGDIATRTTQNNNTVNKLTQQLNTLNQAVAAADTAIRAARDQMLQDQIEFDQRLKILVEKRDELRKKLTVAIEHRPRPVGRVVGANMARDFAYVSLGQSDGVREGMRFSVYPADAAIRPGVKPKGVIEIKNVHAVGSQAQLIHYNLGDPLVVDDVLVNVALDPSGRKPTFVLVQFLDIDGDNVDDRDRIITMIRDQGGEVLAPVAGEVTVDTDFIVMGAEWNTGNEVEKGRLLAEEPVITKARLRSVVTLDVDTFLNYIGYPKWK